MAAISKMNDDGANRLIQAIILRACKDYRNGYRRASLGKAVSNEEWLISDALSFFGASWYAELTDIDSDYMVSHLRMDVVEAAREDYRSAWRQLWQKGKVKKRMEIMALERFFMTRRFWRLSGCTGMEVISDEKKKVVEEMLRRLREVSKKSGKAARREAEQIKAFMRSEDFEQLSDLDPEELIRLME